MNNKPATAIEELILKNLGKEATSIDNLVKQLRLTEVGEIETLSKALVKLEQEHKIEVNRKHKYVLAPTQYINNSNVVNNQSPQKMNPDKIKIGRVDLKKREEDNSSYGFVQMEGIEKGIFVSGKNLNGALDGELVKVYVTGGKKDRLDGKIIEIIEKKSLNSLVGEVVETPTGKLNVVFDDKSFNPVELAEKDSNPIPGEKVVIKMDRNKMSNFEIIKVLGDKNAPGVDLKSIIYGRNFSTDWSREVLEELKNISNSVSEAEINEKNRRDLRDKIIFTIDGDDTKDIDDAISIDKKPDGGYIVGVHIADVSHYVKRNSAIYQEARKRGTSLYMVNTVIHMLPEQLSKGICSLNPNVDRLAKTYQMEFDKNGNMINFEIFRSTIRSRKQMTYNNINKIIEENVVPEDYKEFETDIRELNELGKKIEALRKAKGAIEVESTELKIEFDDQSFPIAIKKREQRSGEKLIENFMVRTNEATAERMTKLMIPHLYRVHDKPDIEKVNELVETAIALGSDVPDKHKNYGIDPKSFQSLLNIIKNDEQVYKLMGNIILRTLRKAVYSPVNIGHFGLASEYYSQETSPIRRFPDLMNHYILDHYIDETVSKEFLNEFRQMLVAEGEYTSFQEREAEKCEREAIKMKVAELMTQHLGEQFTGIITDIREDALYVELSNNAEGRISMSDLPKDNYAFVAKSSLVGQNNKYTIGDTLTVFVKDANKDKRTVDLALTQPDLEKETANDGLSNNQQKKLLKQNNINRG